MRVHICSLLSILSISISITISDCTCILRLQVTLEADFRRDLGLDELDQVEVLFMIEEDLFFEIPYEDMRRLWSLGDIVQYICDKNDIFH